MDPTEPLPEELESLLERFHGGERTALARAISVIENERPGFQGFLHRVLAAGPRARRVGVTGPPGSGKSSLIAALANLCRARKEEVVLWRSTRRRLIRGEPFSGTGSA